MFSHRDENGEVTHYHVVLFGAFLIRDDFHIADCTAETLAVEYVVYLGWVATRLYVIRSVSLFLNRVLLKWRPLATTNFRILSPSGLLVRKPCPPWTSLNTQAGTPTPFQSPTGISISVAMVLMEWLPCLASNLSLRRRGNLVFLLGHQPLVSSQRCDAVRHQSFELELSHPRWATLPGWWSPFSCGKVLFDRIIHGEFVPVSVQVHTTVGQANYLTFWNSRSQSMWPHCWVSY